MCTVRWLFFSQPCMLTQLKNTQSLKKKHADRECKIIDDKVERGASLWSWQQQSECSTWLPACRLSWWRQTLGNHHSAPPHGEYGPPQAQQLTHTRTHSCTVPATGLTYCCVVCEGGFVFISGLIFFFKFMIYLFILFLNLGWVGIFSAQTLKKALICIGTGILSVSILILLLLIGSDQYYYWYYCQDMWLKSFSPSHK